MSVNQDDKKTENLRSIYPRNLEVVTLDNYWKCAENPVARQLMTEIHLLRKQGYGPDYPDHFLPFDNTDFFCMHHLFFHGDGEKKALVAGFRQVTLDLCDYYKTDIPIFESAKKEKAVPHSQALDELISSHRKNKQNMIYSSALTIRKDFRKDRVLSAMILELIPALTVFDMNTKNVSTVLGAAAPRFKTDIKFQTWGYVPLSYHGIILPPFERASIDKLHDPALLLTMTTPSSYALECFNRYQSLIVNRLVVTANDSKQLEVA